MSKEELRIKMREDLLLSEFDRYPYWMENLVSEIMENLLDSGWVKK